MNVYRNPNIKINRIGEIKRRELCSHESRHCHVPCNEHISPFSRITLWQLRVTATFQFVCRTNQTLSVLRNQQGAIVSSRETGILLIALHRLITSNRSMLITEAVCKYASNLALEFCT